MLALQSTQPYYTVTFLSCRGDTAGVTLLAAEENESNAESVATDADAVETLETEETPDMGEATGEGYGEDYGEGTGDGEGTDTEGDADTDTDAEYAASWTPIGSLAAPFRGTFDGSGCTITGLYIDSTEDYQGLFGYTEGALLCNLRVEGDVSGGSNVGGIAGYVENTVLQNCAFCSEEGELYEQELEISEVSGSESVGGLVGLAGADSALYNCLSTASVSGALYVGGLVGYAVEGVTISGALQNGAVSASGETPLLGAITAAGFENNENCYYLDSSCTQDGEAADPADAAAATAISESDLRTDMLIWRMNTGDGAYASTGAWSRGVNYPVPAALSAESVEIYRVIAGEIADGVTVQASPEYAAAGETITLTVTLGDSTALSGLSLTYTDAAGAVQKLSVTWVDGLRTFAMPAADVTVTASAESYVEGETYTITLYAGTGEDDNYGYFSGDETITSASVSGEGGNTDVKDSTLDSLSGQTLQSALDAAQALLTYTATSETQVYACIGWYYEDGTEFEYDEATVFYDNLTLYAKWAYQATLTFDISNRTEGASGASAPETQTRVAGETFTDPGEAEWTTEMSGTVSVVHTFQGWYTEPTGGEKWDFSTVVSEENIPASAFTLYAGWTTTYQSAAGVTLETSDEMHITDAEDFVALAQQAVADMAAGTFYYYLVYIDGSFTLAASDRQSMAVWDTWDSPFYGVVYGQGNTITLEADSDPDTADWSDTGLFYKLDGSSAVYDLTLEANWELELPDVDTLDKREKTDSLSGTPGTPVFSVLCAYNYGTVENCAAQVTVHVESEGNCWSRRGWVGRSYGCAGQI
ncbi:MAG: hypothetical protein LUC40_00250 [Oscillospiraceae bacterium]|nr:hypothetical protein [Oscillospiraceae bacterium]